MAAQVIDLADLLDQLDAAADCVRGEDTVEGDVRVFAGTQVADTLYALRERLASLYTATSGVSLDGQVIPKSDFDPEVLLDGKPHTLSPVCLVAVPSTDRADSRLSMVRALFSAWLLAGRDLSLADSLAAHLDTALDANGIVLHRVGV